MTTTRKNWHQEHQEKRSLGQKVSDFVASILGSWKFIIAQIIIVTLWITLNITAYVNHWDPFPFILLNLLFSTQASFAAPIIMMSQNRQAQRDRTQAEADYMTNVEAKDEIEELQRTLSRIEIEKLDRIIELLKESKKK